MEEEKTFKVGDVVRLNSGGPPMTVLAVKDDGDLACVYYEHAKSAFFDVVADPAAVHASSANHAREYYVGGAGDHVAALLNALDRHLSVKAGGSS